MKKGLKVLIPSLVLIVVWIVLSCMNFSFDATNAIWALFPPVFAIVVALITGGLSLVGVIVTSLITARKSENAIIVAQAVTDTKIQELTREVREHNNFAKRMPVVEEKIKVVNHRIEDLEKYHQPS